MRGLTNGRVVGWAVPYLDEYGRASKVTKWGRIVGSFTTSTGKISYRTVNIHTGEEMIVLEDMIHTTMPADYRYDR